VGAVTIVYKIVGEEEWRQASGRGVFGGSAVDLADGYLHLSTEDQVEATAARHFSGRRDLVLVAIPAALLAPHLKWEPSRQGALFPHLYAALDVGTVLWVKPLPLGADDRHVFPALP
jgi:uncharacterized protein (DUF952 family)